jgi:uncharacterized OB-fold protein
MEGKKCLKCGLLQHSSHLRCMKCLNDNFELIDLHGNAKLLTFTQLNALPAEFQEKRSYFLGIVEFANGVKALGQISGKEKLVINMEVKPEFKKICNNLDGNEVYGFVFEPA